MKIGELSKRTGLTASRIRFYESVGVLKLVQRLPNGYRIYPEEAVSFLNLITSAQQAGFSLDELRELMPMDLHNWKHGVVRETLESKIKDIEVLEHKLSESKNMLKSIIKEIDAKPEDMDCSENAQRVLKEIGFKLKEK